MELKDFLATVTPEGRLVIARMVDRQRKDGTPYKGFAHIVCNTHAEAAQTALDWVGHGNNVYFALASYKQGFHQNEKGKKVVRVRENVDRLKAIWFDIDFKGEYPDAKTAVLAVQVFCQHTKMPRPTLLVGSGNGLHVYWPLTTAVDLDRWQALSESLKEAAKSIGLKADLACTADSCRVLRPPGTINFKDPANPKPVELLYTNGETYAIEQLETALLPWKPTLKAPPPHIKVSSNTDLTNGVGQSSKVDKFEEVIKHCPVLERVVETKGKTCTEPEWMGVLQVLKFCGNGKDWIHKVSEGHPSYDPAATEEKFQQRLDNTAGPTKCATFASYHNAICTKCPHQGAIVSPIQLGRGDIENPGSLPAGWRVATDLSGMERMVITDPVNNITEWVPVLNFIVKNFRAMKSAQTHTYDYSFDLYHGKKLIGVVTGPGNEMSDPHRLGALVCNAGHFIKGKQISTLGDLMGTWLGKLHDNNRVIETADQLGWIEEDGKLTGFTCSPIVFYTDALKNSKSLRPRAAFANIAKMYEPKGELDEWKQVAKFIAEQNHPALTSVLAASFGAPLLKFVGIHGGILSLVSSASGVGKSSVLKASQAVWGSPAHGINSVDDTPKSVAKKMGFLNNLPAYWDELRGEYTVNGFCNLAFQITQGKEKSRLDSSANLRDSVTWETMMICASNESIFDAMARRTEGSDAGMVRTFEIYMDNPPEAELSRAEVTLLFEKLSTNYGHAGYIYGEFLARNAEKVRSDVQKMFALMANTMTGAERFWYGMIAIIVLGAHYAKQLNLVPFDISTMKDFLIENLNYLRSRTKTIVDAGDIEEVLGAYLTERGPNTLIIDDFHDVVGQRGHPKSDYIPTMISTPRSDKLSVVVAQDSGRIRFSLNDLNRFMADRNLPAYGISKKLQDRLGAKECRVTLGVGTRYAGPRVRALEIPATWAGSGRPSYIPDSLTGPESAN